MLYLLCLNEVSLNIFLQLCILIFVKRLVLWKALYKSPIIIGCFWRQPWSLKIVVFEPWFITTWKGLNLSRISQKNFCKAFESIAPGKSTVSKWFREFGLGRSHFNGDNRCGRPVSAATQENAACVKELIREDTRITSKDLQDILGIGMSALNEILHHQLGVHKRCARWVQHQLTEEQKVGRVQWCLTMLEKNDSGRANSTWNIVSSDETWVYQFDPETKAQSSVWLFPGDTPPLKFKRSRSTSKQMVASYNAKTGHITTIPLEERRTVTADWYVHQYLPQVLHAVCTRRPKSGITLHHDNAPAHIAAATREFLASEDVQLMSHPSYSPDLAPRDFSLFPHVKKQLRGTRYDKPQDAIRAFTRAIDSIDKVTWSEVWKSWFQRMAVASKLREGTLKIWHRRKASKCRCFLWLRTFRLTLVHVNGVIDR